MSQTVSLRQLVTALRELPPGDPFEQDMVDVLRSNRVDHEELERHVVWNDEHYTRHLVYVDDCYQIILLGWGIGQNTPVHDHAGQRCWMMIERGRLKISDYCWRQGEGPPRLLNDETIGGDDNELHIDKCACVHKIHNPADWDARAISLHIYSKPFSRCGIYCPDTGTQEIIDLVYESVGPMATAAC